MFKDFGSRNQIHDDIKVLVSTLSASLFKGISQATYIGMSSGFLQQQQGIDLALKGGVIRDLTTDLFHRDGLSRFATHASIHGTKGSSSQGWLAPPHVIFGFQLMQVVGDILQFLYSGTTPHNGSRTVIATLWL